MRVHLARSPWPLVVVAALAVACKPTPEKIATWKGTQHGPAKLREVVQDGKAEPKLRALAAAALVEIGQGQEAARDLATADPETRARTVHELVPILIDALGDSRKPGTPTNQRQRAAKDALFVVRGDATREDRYKIDDALVEWTTADLAARATQGGESSEKILRAIGSSSVKAVLPLVKPGPDLQLAARLVGELGDPEAKKAAAAPLIAQAKASRGDEALVALGQVGGDDATAALMDLAQHGSGEVRKKALYALAQGRMMPGDHVALDGAVAIARDAHAPGEVREAAFQVIEKLGPVSINACLPFLKDPSSDVRFRAIEATLKAGGPAAVGRLLAALPEDRPMKSEDLDNLVVHDLTLVGKPALPELVKAAQAKGAPALGRVAALRALGSIGTPAEAAQIAPLTTDSTPVKALAPPSTVGAEASRAKDAIAARR